MKFVQPLIYALGAAVLMLSAVSPGPRAQAPPDDAAQPRAAAQLPNPPGAGRGLRQAGRPVTPEEWQNVIPWMRKHCPNRLDFVENRLADRPAQQATAKQLIVARYRQIQNVRDRQIQNAMLSQEEAKDRIFGAQIKLRQGIHQGDSARQAEAKTELQAAVGKLLDAEVKIRQIRIARLQAELGNLTQKRQQVVEQWYNRELNQAARIAAPADREPDDGGEVSHQAEQLGR